MNTYSYTDPKNGETTTFKTKREINTVILFDTDEGEVGTVVSKSTDADKLIAKEQSFDRPWLSNFRAAKNVTKVA